MNLYQGMLGKGREAEGVTATEPFGGNPQPHPPHDGNQGVNQE